MMAAAKPVILPDKFSGESSWDDWEVHFGHCAAGMVTIESALNWEGAICVFTATYC